MGIVKDYFPNALRCVYHLPMLAVQFCQMLYIRVLGVHYGKGIKLIGLTRWYIKGNVKIGNYFTSASNQKHSIDTSACSKITVAPHAHLVIGDNVGMTCTSIQCEDRIEIGDHVIIGAGVLIMDSNFHDTSWKMRRAEDTGCSTAAKAPVKIGNDCFIGTRSVICKGVEIGPRSIIAAGSVVVKSVPSDEVWGGNPAIFIRKLTS